MTWQSTGVNDYHQFTNVSVTSTPLDATGVKLGSERLAPNSNPDSYRAVSGAPLTVAASWGVLNNDYSPSGAPLTALLVTNASHGVLSLAADGSFTYTPTAGYVADTFTYQANDGTLTGKPVTVTLTVTYPPPTVPTHTFNAVAGSTLSVAAPGLLAGAVNPDGLTLRTIVTSTTRYGSLTVNLDGSFSYTPGPNTYGTDTFSFQAVDNSGATAVVTDTFNVARSFLPPVAVDDAYALAAGSTLTTSAASSVAMFSQTGDYIGQGNSYNFTAAGGATITGRVLSGGVYTNAVAIYVSAGP